MHTDGGNCFAGGRKMAKRKSKVARRQQARKEKLAAESLIRQKAALNTTGPLTAPNAGMSSPFRLRSGSNPTNSVSYRHSAHSVHAHQLSFSACDSNRVAWFNRVDCLLWRQRAWHD